MREKKALIKTAKIVRVAKKIKITARHGWKLQMIQWKGSIAAIMKIQNFVRLLWIELEGHMQMCLWKAMTETVKTYKKYNTSQHLIDNFTSMRAIIQYLIYRGSIIITFNFFPN